MVTNRSRRREQRKMNYKLPTLRYTVPRSLLTVSTHFSTLYTLCMLCFASPHYHDGSTGSTTHHEDEELIDFFL